MFLSRISSSRVVLGMTSYWKGTKPTPHIWMSSSAWGMGSDKPIGKMQGGLPYRFNLHSDMHIELVRPATFLPPALQPTHENTDLYLAGDIELVVNPRYRLFLLACADAYARRGGRVFFIKGNHEIFHCDSYEAGLRRIEEIAKERDNLFFLNRTKIQVAEKVTLLGTTLHSYIPERFAREVNIGVNDFYLIGDRDHRWTVEAHNQEHALDVAWLEQTIAEIPNDHKIIVMTHHGPIGKGISLPQYERDDRPIKTAFQTDLTHHNWFGRVHTWVYGHTHFNADFTTSEGVRILSNQMGYDTECDGTYQKDHVVTI